MSWINEVRRLYEQPGRYYHNWDHIRHCLDLLLDLDEEVSTSDWLRLRFALAYHDAVYDTRTKDSEERSARLAMTNLCIKGLCDDDMDEVERLILLTKHHDPADDDKIGQIMCDIDCAILGEAPQNYNDYADAVRMEYDWVSDEGWRAGRIVVLGNFLARPQIFRSRYFQHLEQPARDNIERELEDMSISKTPCAVCNGTGLAYDTTEFRMVPCGGICCTVKS